MKRWLGQAMQERLHALPAGPTWWAECGSIRWIFGEDGDYFPNATKCGTRQRATPGAVVGRA